jgi:triacylglycerol lipase
MSAFVELPPDQYSPVAFADFVPATDFTIGNARALMWMSQLAYETTKPATIAQIGPIWGFSSVTPFFRNKISLTASFDTCGIIGERHDAIVLAFAGTDPAVWETLATDVNIQLTSNENTHSGFQAALEAIQPDIQRAIDLSRRAGKPLFIAGHSLGAALAALAARFCDTNQSSPEAVYGYGMPRAGGPTFQDSYNRALGTRTFRLVHGLDAVARVPMSEIGFRHVGRVLKCESGGKFNRALLSAQVSDEPEFTQGAVDSLLTRAESVLSGQLFSPPGPGSFGPLFRFVPQPIRDHLPDSYYKALAP